MTKREKIGLVALFGVLTLIIIALSISIVLVSNIVIVGTSMNVSFVSKEIACKITGSAKYKYDNTETSYTNARVVGSSTTSKTLVFEPNVEYTGNYTLDFEQMVIDATGEVIYSFSIENTGHKSICAKVEVGYVDNMNRILTKGEYITDLEGISGYIIHAGQTKSFELKLTIKDMSLDASATSKITMVLATEFPEDDVVAKVVDYDGTLLAVATKANTNIQFPTNIRTISLDDNGTTKYFQGYLKTNTTSSNLSGYYYGKNYSYSAVTALPDNLILPKKNIKVSAGDVYTAYFDVDPDRSQFTFAKNTSSGGWTISVNPTEKLSGVYVVPTLYQGKLITSIGAHAFDGQSKLTGVELPGSIEDMGDYAFNGCTNIKKIELPDTITAIGPYTFAQCSKLTEIIIPEYSVKEIGAYAFYQCPFTSLTIPEGVEEITGGGTFSNCRVMTFLGLPSTLKSIKYGSVEDCPSLVNIEINKNNLTYTSSDNDGNAVNAVIERTSQTLVMSCKGTIIPSSVKVIGEGSFSRGYKTTIEVPEGVEEIENNAFYWQSSLTKLVLPSTIKKIGSSIIKQCKNLNEIIIESSNNVYTSQDAGGNECNIIIDKVNKSVIAGCKNSVIPNYVTTIISGSFGGMGLTSINIPTSVSKIEGGAFSALTSTGNDKLANITVAVDNPNYTSRDADGNECNVLIDKQTNRLIQGSSNGTVVPEGVTILESYSYAGISITTCQLPSTLKEIYSGAFYATPVLDSVVIPEGVETLDNSAFTYSKIKTVSIPSTIVNMKPSVFMNCTQLSNVELKSSLISNNMFKYCSSLTNITLPNGVGTIGEQAFYSCSKLTSITIPTSTTKIGSYAFFGCNALQSFTFADPNNWYTTNSSTNWNNMTNGTLTDVTDATANVQYMINTKKELYWYKAS